MTQTELDAKDLRRRCLFKYFHTTSALIGGVRGVGRVHACPPGWDVIDVRLATDGAVSPVQVNNEASKTGREDATLNDLASRKGIS